MHSDLALRMQSCPSSDLPSAAPTEQCAACSAALRGCAEQRGGGRVAVGVGVCVWVCVCARVCVVGVCMRERECVCADPSTPWARRLLSELLSLSLSLSLNFN